MATYEYAIASVENDLINNNVEDLIDIPPEGMNFQPFSTYAVAASGLEYGDGFPSTSWKFAYLSKVMLDTLMSFIGSNQSGVVFIVTPNEAGTFLRYTAIMHRPKAGEERSWEPGGWRDVTIRFTQLEEVSVIHVSTTQPAYARETIRVVRP